MTTRALLYLTLGMIAPSLCLASQPIKPVAVLEPQLGYIAARLAPKKGGGQLGIYFARLDPSTGSTVWSYGMSPEANSRKQFDVALAGFYNDWGSASDGTMVVVPVHPGRWVIAGVWTPTTMTSLSLGSYAFDVKPGEITYIGVVSVGREDGKSPVPAIAAVALSPDLVNFGTTMNIVMSSTITLTFPADTALPVELSGRPGRVPEIARDVRFNNALRGLVSRAADLPRVMKHEPTAASSPARIDQTDKHAKVGD